MTEGFTARMAADGKLNLDQWRKKVGTPAHKLITGGAQADHPPVKEAVESEVGFLGSVHASEKMQGGGLEQVVDTARTRYKGALGALPQETREKIGAGNVEESVGATEKAFRDLMRQPKATPIQSPTS